MTDRYDFAIQLLAGYAAAVTVFLLFPSIRNRILEGGCLASIGATLAVLTIALWTHGVTSTLPIGVAYTAGIAFGVSVLVLALLRLLHGSRSE